MKQSFKPDKVKQMKDQQTVIFLVRHGETDLPYINDQRIDDNRRLTKKGKEQSKKNGEYLSAFSPSIIFSSPMQRTIETSEIIKTSAGASKKIVIEKELHEIYDNASWYSIETRIPELFERIIKKHSGEHIICVSHQDVIEGTLKALNVTSDEADLPCQMGQIYRLVFAGNRFVQVNKLDPSK